jgi:hypothetical protein
MVIVFVGLMLLFQPIAKVTMARQVWNIVDVVVAVGLVVTLFIKNKKG